MSKWTDLDIDSGGDYLELKGGEVVTFHILSDNPSKELIHWVDRKKNRCEGKGCSFCGSGNKAKQRWTADVFDRKTQSVKKLEFGAMIAAQLRGIAEMLSETGQNINSVDIRIKTTGSGMETDYSVLHVPKAGEIPTEILSKYVVDEEIPF